MDLCFGEFITNQYGLLKEVLSNLQPCDLRNARLVCRDWQNAVDAVRDKNPKLFSCSIDEKDGRYNIPTAVLPDLILYYSVNYKNIKPNLCENCERRYLVCPCKVSNPDSDFVSVLANWDVSLSSREESLYWKTPSVLMLSSSQHIKISTFYFDRNRYCEPITDKFVIQCTGGEEPIKAILIFSYIIPLAPRESDWVNSILSHITARQGLTFAVGGGRAGGIGYKKGVTHKDGQFKSGGVVLITFRGDNVSAQSDVIAPVSSETKWSSFKQRTEDVPAGGTQIAFLAQNIRIRSTIGIRDSEYNKFKKYFPNALPCYFRSWLEYGIRSSSTDPAESEDGKRARFSFDNEFVTSVLLLTLKKA